MYNNFSTIFCKIRQKACDLGIHVGTCGLNNKGNAIIQTTQKLLRGEKCIFLIIQLYNNFNKISLF